ncbi:MAG: tetratricopeptide repeat protein [Metallibacterium scheffleri]
MGVVKWAKVLYANAASISWADPQEVEAEAAAIGSRFGAAGVRQQSTEFIIDRESIHDTGESLVARYKGSLPITHVDAVCNEKHYRLTAYGVDKLWYDLGSLVTDLLAADVHALQSQVLQLDRAGWFSKRVHELSPQLHKIIESEFNVAVIEAALTGKSNDELDAAAGDDYRQKLQQVLVPALHRIYRLAGRDSLWPIPLIALLVAVVGWWLGMAWIGFLAAAAAIPMSLSHFGWRANALLKGPLQSKERTAQAVALIKKTNGHRAIYALHVALALAVAAIAMQCVLHPRSVTTRVRAQSVTLSNPSSRIAAKTINTTDMPDASNTNAALERALTLLNEDKYGEARSSLLPIAERGDARAYLPLAQALMRDRAGTFMDTKQIHMREAEFWSRKAAIAYPQDAKTAYIAGLAAESGLGKNPDMAVAIPLFRRSAKLGDVDAMNALGLSYLSGAGVGQSDAEARFWYTKAADHGNAAAIFNIGLMDWEGLGISAPDRAHALMLWRKAAAAGSERAKQMLARIHEPAT